MKIVIKITVSILAIVLFTTNIFAQVGIGTNSPNASAKLDVSSTNQGFLPPRMTSEQRNAISSPAQGLIIYCTNCGANGELEIFNGTFWTNISGATTEATLPVIATTSITDLKSYTATSGGNITYDGGSPIIARGVCWGTTPLPTNFKDKTSNGSGIGNFASAITGLIADTTYYIRAYATNSSGTSYGNQITVKTDKQLLAYLFIDRNETTHKNTLNEHMSAEGSSFRGYNINAPSTNQSTFDAQINAYLSYPGWGVTSPSIFTSPVSATSGGLDKYGVYISAYQFQTLEVPGNTLPIGDYAWFTLIVPTEATNGQRYSTINSGNTTSASSNSLMNSTYSNLIINYNGSKNIPAGTYRLYSTFGLTNFRFSPGANPLYFHGGGLVN